MRAGRPRRFHAVVRPEVGNATQVISVVGAGGSEAKVDVFERTAAGWQAVGAGIPAYIGENGMAPDTHDGQMMTPMGIYTLDFAFGTHRIRAVACSTSRSDPTTGGTAT